MIDLHRREGETEESFIWRIGRLKDSGELDLEWPQIAAIINREFRADETEYREESAYRKPYQQAKRFYEAGVFEDLTTEKYIEVLKFEQRELKKERQKLSDEKLEYNRWLREQARDELIAEQICKAIKETPEIVVPKKMQEVAPTGKAGILLLADSHYGTEFKIQGLRGEILNEYSPEIFEKRMWELLVKTIEIVKKEGLEVITVYDLGDEVDGILRVSQLMKLRYGVIDASVRYAKFMVSWLNELTKYVRVRYQMVSDSNHCQLRMLGQPKGTFKDENVATIIREKIMDKLEKNPNFEFYQNPTGYIYDNIYGFNIVGIHGETKNLAQTIKDFSHLYNLKIHLLVAGHKHHQNSENVGIASDVVSVPSIIGIDDYSMSINKASDPGATFLIVEPGKGKTVEYNIKL